MKDQNRYSSSLKQKKSTKHESVSDKMKHDETNPQDGRLNKTVDCKTHEIGSKSINMERKWLKTDQKRIKIGCKSIKLV